MVMQVSKSSAAENNCDKQGLPNQGEKYVQRARDLITAIQASHSPSDEPVTSMPTRSTTLSTSEQLSATFSPNTPAYKR